MHDVSRRKFLGLSIKLAAMMGLASTAVPGIAECLAGIAQGTAPVVWLQGLSCSGCSVSFLDSEEPGPDAVITESISLLFHPTLSAATGHMCKGVLDNAIRKGGYLLVVEGSVPASMPEACVIDDESFSEQLSRTARNATAVVAVGTCAAFGGIPAAENNLTGAIGVPEFLEKEKISVPVVRIPGCPSHPDWVVGTLAYVLKFGMPQLDSEQKPTMFFSKILHEQCPRFTDYEREKFAKTFADEGCLFKLGCLGPNTRADCTVRNWNSGVNSCVRAGAPCIGCTSSMFPGKADFPFFRKTEDRT